MKIIDGPTKESLLEAFGKLQAIKFCLEKGTQLVIINGLEYENGRGVSFNFKTRSGASGYYNTEKKTGYIFPPEARPPSK